MAHARIVLGEASAPKQPSLLRLVVVALVVAVAFDAVSTALAWDVVRALEGAVRRGPVHAVHPADVRDTSRRPDVPPSGQSL